MTLDSICSISFSKIRSLLLACLVTISCHDNSRDIQEGPKVKNDIESQRFFEAWKKELGDPYIAAWKGVLILKMKKLPGE